MRALTVGILTSNVIVPCKGLWAYVTGASNAPPSVDAFEVEGIPQTAKVQGAAGESVTVQTASLGRGARKRAARAARDKQVAEQAAKQAAE